MAIRSPARRTAHPKDHPSIPGPAPDEILTRNPPRWDDDGALFIGSISKAMRVLYAFGGNEARLTATQIARLSGLDASSTQRFIYTLTALGLLEKEERTKQYRLSVRLLDFAYLYLRADPLCAIANPHLHALARESGEPVSLSILDRADVIYVARYPGAEQRDVPSLIGGRMPSFCTSNGRVQLAQLPRAEVEEIIRVADLRPLTPYSLTDPALIMERIDEARDRGYCVVKDESEIGILSIAVPVLAGRGGPAAAINMPLSAQKWRADEAVERLLPGLLSVAEVIGRSLRAISL